MRTGLGVLSVDATFVLLFVLSAAMRHAQRLVRQERNGRASPGTSWSLGLRETPDVEVEQEDTSPKAPLCRNGSGAQESTPVMPMWRDRAVPGVWC